MTGTVVLDNEAVQALRLVSHPKHRRALAHVEVVATRNRKARRAVSVVVPTAVRVEAGWDRSDPASAFINLLGIRDVPLGGAVADRAATLVGELGVSVAHAHLGAVVEGLPEAERPVTVVSSDPGDMRLVAGATPVTVAVL